MKVKSKRFGGRQTKGLTFAKGFITCLGRVRITMLCSWNYCKGLNTLKRATLLLGIINTK
jgi:hypothetical protein